MLGDMIASIATARKDGILACGLLVLCEVLLSLSRRQRWRRVVNVRQVILARVSLVAALLRSSRI